MKMKKVQASPFYQTAENQNLIGVANLFLGVLFHDVALSYQTPIISQQGEVIIKIIILTIKVLSIYYLCYHSQ